MAWQDALADTAAARIRPRPEKWSALEYGCHVRDVFALYAVRLDLMLSEDDPLFANWDQDETAIASDYGAQDPAVVRGEILDTAGALADAFDAVPRSSGHAPAGAVTAPTSRSRRSPATSSTTRSITCMTSHPARSRVASTIMA